MPSWGAKRTPMATRRARGRIKMWGNPLSHPSTSSFVLILFSVILLAASVRGQCGTDCPDPDLSGGGTPAFAPDLPCYESGASVNASCPDGYLYGNPVVEECVSGLDNSSGYWSADPLPACEAATCGAQSAPTDGSIDDPTASDLYDEVTYTCDGDLYLDGPAMAVCQGTGLWSPVAPPLCSGDCTLPVITNGDATQEDSGLHEGVEVSLACDPDYTLTGPDSVTCHDLDWDPEVAECLADCDSPVVANSNYSTGNQGMTDHGEYILVSCDEGYSSGEGVVVLEPMTCYNSTWEEEVTCYVNCLRPTGADVPDFGYVANDTSTTYLDGNIAMYSCNDTYTLVGDSYATCSDGLWITDTPPECKAPCVVPFVNNSNLNDTTDSTLALHGSDTVVTCSDGYGFPAYSTFDGALTCVDGAMNETDVECRLTCASPDVDDSNWAAELDRGPTPYGGDIIVDCDDGFTSGTGVDENETLTCSEGLWDRTVECYANCPLNISDTGLQLYPSSGPYYHTDTVYFNCTEYEFYKFTGADILTCNDGVWSEDYPVCKDSCNITAIADSNYAVPDPNDPNDPVYPSEYITVICDEGYTSGNGPNVTEEQLYCDDVFFNRTVYCYENCYNVTAPDKGSYAPVEPEYYAGEQVDFSCIVGYGINGNETITCIDGYWSSEFPTCLLNCDDPGNPANGSQVGEPTYVHNSEVEFTCDEGLDVLGARVITCFNGNWSDPVPVCINETIVAQITLTCLPDSFEVTIPTSLLGDNLLVSNVAIGGDPTCIGVIDEPLLTLTSKLDECNTIRSEVHNATYAYYDEYVNTVIDIGTHTGPSVDIPITCTYNREGTFEALSYELNSYDISKSLSQIGQYEFTFDIYSNSSFTDVEEYSPYYVGLNENVYFGVGIVAATDTLRVKSQECWATPTSSASNPIRWDLISNSCPSDPTVNVTEDVSRALFSVSSFRFNQGSGVVYIHCEVLVCQYGGSQCDLDCDGSRRRRRSAPYVNPNRVQRLRVGPITWVDSEESIPDIFRRSASLKSEEDSPFIYIIVITTLASMCVLMVASLAVVTSRLVTITKSNAKISRLS